MSVVNLKFRNNTVQLVSDEPERLLKLSEKLNGRIEELQAQNQSITDTKLAYMVALILESELESAIDKLEAASSPQKDTKAMDAILSKTINQVAEYIDHLSDKFEKN